MKSRKIPDGFMIKQVRVVRKASGYFLMFTIECSNTVPAGHAVGLDLGLDKFVATSDNE